MTTSDHTDPEPRPNTDDQLVVEADMLAQADQFAATQLEQALAAHARRLRAECDAARAEADMAQNMTTEALGLADRRRAAVENVTAERDALRAELRTMKIAHQSLAAIARQHAKDLTDFAEMMDPTTDQAGKPPSDHSGECQPQGEDQDTAPPDLAPAEPFRPDTDPSVHS